VTAGTLRCADVVELLTEWTEGGLDDAARAEIEEHLVVCAPCATFAGQLRLTRTALRGASSAPPSALRARLLERFSAWAEARPG